MKDIYLLMVVITAIGAVISIYGATKSKRLVYFAGVALMVSQFVLGVVRLLKFIFELGE